MMFWKTMILCLFESIVDNHINTSILKCHMSDLRHIRNLSNDMTCLKINVDI